MQTIERKVNPKVRAKQAASANILWITTMNALEEELERLYKLFSAASFMLSEQDFQGLFRLRQSHSGLKAKMAEYFRKFRDPRPRLRRNTRRSQIETRDKVQLELQDLSSRLQKFIDKLLKASVSSRGYL
ncbi:hypothetical protein [Pedobacter ginsengisoli]|uniref:hypothetical protein n=1 Tax=Pedobacter ginsengisoli TaxID=363852 RepID=UPI00254FA022|nr:hypothetical protein [Pedobacter ginsengisoli]